MGRATHIHSRVRKQGDRRERGCRFRFCVLCALAVSGFRSGSELPFDEVYMPPSLLSPGCQAVRCCVSRGAVFTVGCQTGVHCSASLLHLLSYFSLVHIDRATQ